MARLLTENTGLAGGVAWSATQVSPDADTRMLFVWGVFDGARVNVQISPNGAYWFDWGVAEENRYFEITLPPGVHIRVGVFNPGTQTRINAEYC